MVNGNHGYEEMRIKDAMKHAMIETAKEMHIKITGAPYTKPFIWRESDQELLDRMYREFME